MMGQLKGRKGDEAKKTLCNRSATQNWVEANICSHKGAEIYTRTEFSNKQRMSLGKHCLNIAAYLQHITLKQQFLIPK